MYFPKEFRPLVPPPYAPAAVGRWSIAEAPPERRRHVLGYFRNRLPMPDRNWCLRRGGEVWMSQTPMELESQGYHARMAAGHVLVCGLGMGTLVYNLLRNPKVERVSVLEKELDVVRLLEAAAPWFKEERFRTGSRLSVRVCDALEFVPGKVFRAGNPDLLLVDVWRRLGEDGTEADVLKIQANVRAERVGWWGQELDLVSWLQANGNRLPLTGGDVARWQAHLGFKVLGAEHPYYPALALAAATWVAFTQSWRSHGSEAARADTGTARRETHAAAVQTGLP